MAALGSVIQPRSVPLATRSSRPAPYRLVLHGLTERLSGRGEPISMAVRAAVIHPLSLGGRQAARLAARHPLPKPDCTRSLRVPAFLRRQTRRTPSPGLLSDPLCEFVKNEHAVVSTVQRYRGLCDRRGGDGPKRECKNAFHTGLISQTGDPASAPSLSSNRRLGGGLYRVFYSIERPSTCKRGSVRINRRRATASETGDRARIG